MIINHNIAALNTYRQLSANNGATSKSLEKLSSGLRINRAGDDAAGLAISEKMRGQIRGLEMASKNAQDGISLIQTAEGALNETHSILQRMKELAIQASNGTNTLEDRGEIQKEINQLTSEINIIGNTTEFNTQKLLKGGGNITGAIGTPTNVIGEAAGGTDAKAGLTAKGLTITGAANGPEYNDFTVSIANDTDEKIDIDYEAKTIVITLDLSNTPSTDISGLDVNTVGGAAPAGGPFAFSGNATGLDTGDIGELGTTVNGSSASAGTQGYTEFSITKALGVGDTITVAGKTITVYEDAAAKGDDDYGISLADAATADAQAAAIKAMDFEGLTASNTGATVKLAQTVAGTGDVTGPVLGNVDGIGFSTNLQIGASTGQSFTLDINDMRSIALGISSSDKTSEKPEVINGKTYTIRFNQEKVVTDGTDNTGIEFALDVSNIDNATAAIKALEDGINQVSAERSKLGAFQNRLEHTINNLGTSAENLSAAESRIRDVDMAKEIMEYTKFSILNQAASAMLAQANQQPQSVLQLLR